MKYKLFNVFPLLLLLLIAVLLGCAPAQVMEKYDWTGSSVRGLDVDSVPGYPPLQDEDFLPYNIEVPWFFVEPARAEVEPYREEQGGYLAYDKEEPGIPKVRIAPGYRVQLYSGSSREIARVKRTELKVRYQYEVYLIYEAPFYKVRIGDFWSRDDALRFSRVLRKEGFRESWVVKSPVILK